MTVEQLQAILVLPTGEMVKGLQVENPTVPLWTDLLKQYDVEQHDIFDTVKYPPKLNDNNQDDLKRTGLALQKLVVDRLAQSMFGTPVKRTYNSPIESETTNTVISLIEEVYGVRNNIDTSNIERAKQLNAACQIVTVWKVKEKPQMYNGEQSKYKLTHKSYSEMNGYKIYPIFDNDGDILAISIYHTDTDNIEHQVTYLNTETPSVITLVKLDDWVEIPEATKPLTIFPCIYQSYTAPVWGGNGGTLLVSQLEEVESFDGLYVKRNSLPTFLLDFGETSGRARTNTEEKQMDSRHIVVVGKGGKMQDVTWAGAGVAVENRVRRLRNAFFEQCQVPDTSFTHMIQSNTSAENKELVFADVKAKAKDLGGEWAKFFYEELEIVKHFLSVILPSYTQELMQLSVKSTIVPYNVQSRKETADYVATAGGSMSLATQVRVLGEVDNVDNEITKIEEEKSADTNLLV